MKIHFTQEHFNRLYSLAAEALFNGMSFQTKLGEVLNIYELLHTTTINQLGEIKVGLIKKIEKMEQGDEWIDPDNDKLEELKTRKELINLIIGYKRYILEQEFNKKEREKLETQLSELKESQKTPEDRIKELEAQLKELEES